MLVRHLGTFFVFCTAFSYLALILLLRSTSETIRKATSNQIDQAEAYCDTSYDTASTELVHEAHPSSASQDQVGPAQRSSGSRTVDFVALDIEVCREEKQRWKYHRNRLERSGMLREDERGEESGRHRILCQECK